MSRSLSVDAVHTGARGHVRSLAWRHTSRRVPAPGVHAEPQRPAKWGSPGRGAASTAAAAADQYGSSQHWAPVVTASHFPPTSPFAGYVHPPPLPAVAQAVPALASGAPSASEAPSVEATELACFGSGAASPPPPQMLRYHPLQPTPAPLLQPPPAAYHPQPPVMAGFSSPCGPPSSGTALPPPINAGPTRQRSLQRREVKFETPPPV